MLAIQLISFLIALKYKNKNTTLQNNNNHTFNIRFEKILVSPTNLPSKSSILYYLQKI